MGAGRRGTSLAVRAAGRGVGLPNVRTLLRLAHVQREKIGLQQVNILYVEDYDLVLFTVKQLLELEGWHVDVCREGNAALKMFESNADYDLIVLDYELPGARGLDLLRKARSMPSLHTTPIIMFTASECEAEALEAGADAFLKKPGGIRDLIPTIEFLLNGQHRSDEAVNHSTFERLL